MSSVLRRDRIIAVLLIVVLVVVVLSFRVWFANLQWAGGIRIDVALIVLPFMAIARGATFGIVAGFLLGILVDATAPGYMGASSVGFALVGFAAGSFGKTMYMDLSLARGVLVFGSVLIFDIVFGLLSRGFASPFFLGVLYTLVSALLSGLVAGLVTAIGRTLRLPGRAEPEVPEHA